MMNQMEMICIRCMADKNQVDTNITLANICMDVSFLPK